MIDWNSDFSACYPSEYAESLLDDFCRENKIASKGKLSVMVQLTRRASEHAFPLSMDDFRTEKQGQVAGMGGANLKKILAHHGITSLLSSEGGRTSRGSMKYAENYLALLNNLNEIGECDFYGLENYWIDQVRKFLEGKPFKLATDQSKTVGALLEDLFDQAKKRQKANPGTQYMGTILQHLVAAKLQVIMPDDSFEVHGADVADAPTGRSGDFAVGDTVVHCTTAPGTPLIEKCAANVAAGCHPVIVTVQERLQMGRQLVEDRNLEDSVDVWDIQQFLSTNILEHSLFDTAQRTEMMTRIVDNYNAIIARTETDQSLRIELLH